MSIKVENLVGAGAKNGRRKSDLYPTPKEATFTLLDLLSPVLSREGLIWEPACGENDMADAMREKGYTVIGSDILSGVDFLTAPVPNGAAWIITNPPFSLAEQFIRRAYDTELPFAFLLKSQFWHAARRLPLFQDCKPNLIAPLTWRPDFNFKDSGKHGCPLMDVIWCVWLRHSSLYQGGTQYIPLPKPKI